MNQLLLQYSYLQMLDLLTTMAFLLHGIHEGNPLVRLALRYSSHPWGGLLLVKALALGLGFYCWRCGRQRLLTRINILVCDRGGLEPVGPDRRQSRHGLVASPALKRAVSLPSPPSAAVLASILYRRA